MVIFCMAPGCSNSGLKEGVSYHRLPLKDNQRLAKWLNNMKLKNPPAKLKHCRVCSVHFSPDSYIRDFKSELTGSKRRFTLKPEAEPTIFNFSSYKKSTVNAKPSTTTLGHDRVRDTVRENVRQSRRDQRDRRKNIAQIHTQLDEEIRLRKEQDTCELNHDLEQHQDTPQPQDTPRPQDRPQLVSSSCQTDPLPPPPPCSSPCCNGQPPKCLSPCCMQTPKNIPAPHMSTPKKSKPDAELDLDCSFFSDVSFANQGRDDSYHPSSDSESENEYSDTDGLDNFIDNSQEADKYIVFSEELDVLFQKCQGDPLCAAPIDGIKKTFLGSLVTISGTCNNHHSFVWRSQPLKNRMPVGNLLLAGAILYTGNTYTTMSEIAECLKLKIFCDRDFYYIQKKWLLPSINLMWTSHQEELLSEYRDDADLIVAGDGRCDSPGHSATYGTYSLMDTKTNLVLATNVVRVTEVKNSYNMEKEGLTRCLSQLEESDVKIATLATDRHPQITKFLREDHPTISHQFDVWHMAKGITKKLSAAAKRKECHDLLPWVKSVSNHFWWCADTCNGSATQLKERWLSILRHIVNKHEWTVSTEYTSCEHDKLSDEDAREKEWLKSGSASHKALQAIVTDKRTLKDMELITEFCHTGDLEVFHNVLLKYVPKRLAFGYEGMVARTMLAAIENNMNIGREQATTKLGEKQWKLQWSKGSQSFVVKKVKEAKDYTFREDLMNATLDRLENKTRPEVGAIIVPDLARRTIGKGEKPSKSDAVDGHITRFRQPKDISFT